MSTWTLPVARGSGWTGSLGTSAPPAGWSRRVEAAGATVTSDHRTELDFELWPGPGRSRTSGVGLIVGIAALLLALYAMDHFVRTVNRADRKLARVWRRSR